jgi:hypothetical protein
VASESVGDYAVCKPNISGPGRVRRLRAGWVLAVVSLVWAAALIALHTSSTWRLSLFFPTQAAATTFFQVTRNTCVAHALQGTFEHADFSKTKVDEADAAASRRVAFTIYRDGILIGLICAALAAASAFL